MEKMRYLSLMYADLVRLLAEYRNLITVEQTIRGRVRASLVQRRALEREIVRCGGAVPSQPASERAPR